MGSDERHEDVPQKVDATVTESEATEAPKTEDVPTGFPDRWGGGPDDTAHSGEEFADTWSGDPDASTEKGEEFGELYAADPDASSERTEEFGAEWSGDNEEQPKS
jgi:hypothetical protein